MGPMGARVIRLCVKLGTLADFPVDENTALKGHDFSRATLEPNIDAAFSRRGNPIETAHPGPRRHRLHRQGACCGS
jgi:hypothetical protein